MGAFVAGKGAIWRVGVLVVIFGLAFLALLSRDRREVRAPMNTTSPASRPAWVKGGRAGAEWYESQVAKWSALEFVSLSSESSLSAVVRSLVERRFPGTSIDPSILSRDITRHFMALSTATPQEYAQRLAEYRTLRSDWFEDRWIHLWYRDTGKTLTNGMSVLVLLDGLWACHDAGRPAAIANRALIQVAESRTIAETQDRARLDVYWRIVPSFSFSKGDTIDWDFWGGPFNQVFPRIFQPIPPLEILLKDDRRVLVCTSYWIVQTTRGAFFPINVDWFYDPHRQRWHLASIGNCYPGKVCWPF